MQSGKLHTGPTTTLAASLVSSVLGSVHAFSLFLVPLESQFDSSRSAVSLTYSLALAALTFAVLVGPRWYAHRPAWQWMLGACTLAASGTLLAGLAGSLATVWLGYGLVFGAANGLGYGFGLQIAAQANPGREGAAMGIVTASYAFGAMLSSVLLGFALRNGGISTAMTALSGILFCAGLLSSALLRKSNVRFGTDPEKQRNTPVSWQVQALLWLGYFGGVVAGLMVIGHAAGIAGLLRPQTAPWIAPATIAACNLLGSLVAGWLADRYRPGPLLAGLSVLAGAALAGLAAFGEILNVIVVLGLIGFSYGGTIAAYPAAIAKLFGMGHSARIYGRVFTAWGCAGLAGPWLAGQLFDWAGNYRLALLAAACAAFLSVGALATIFFNKKAPPNG